MVAHASSTGEQSLGRQLYFLKHSWEATWEPSGASHTLIIAK